MSRWTPTWPHLIVMALLLIGGAGLILAAIGYMLLEMSWPLSGILGGLVLLFFCGLYVKTVNEIHGR